MRAALAVVALAAGCLMAPPAPVAPESVPVDAASAANTAERLLASLARILALDESGLAAEIARRQGALAAAPTHLAGKTSEVPIENETIKAGDLRQTKSIPATSG